jgi:hypothetical protein
MADAQIIPEVAKGLALGLVEQQFQIQNTTISSLVDKAINAYRDGQAEKSLQMFAGDICPYTKEDVEGVILENLSSQDRDPKTGQKKAPELNTPERARYNKTQEVADAMRVYLESDGQQIPPAFINELITYVKHMPQYRDILYDQNGQLTPDANQLANNITQNLLRQPQYRRAIHKFFTERLDPKKRLANINAYEALKREIQALETQINKLPEEVNQAQIQQAREELEQARKELVEASGKRTRLEILTEQAPQLREELRLLKAQASRLRINVLPIEQRIKELQTQLATETDPNTIQSLNQEIQQRINDPSYVRYQLIQSQIQSINSDLDEIESLTKIFTEAKSKFEQKKQEYEELLRRQASSQTSQERARLETELQRKKLELHDLEAQIIAERIRYASDIIAIPAEAAKEFFNEALGEAANYYKEEAKKAAKKEGKEEAKKVETLAEKLARKKKGEKYLPDKKQARKILTLLMQPDGVAVFMNEIAKNPANYGLQQSEVQFIIDKITAGDTDFIQNTGVSLAKSVLADYLLAGGRLSRDDIIALGNADWVKTLIDDGLKVATDKRAQIEGLIGKDVLDKLSEIRAGHKNIDWLMSNWWKFGAVILGILVLLGIKAATGF